MRVVLDALAEWLSEKYDVSLALMHCIILFFSFFVFSILWMLIDGGQFGFIITLVVVVAPLLMIVIVVANYHARGPDYVRPPSKKEQRD